MTPSAETSSSERPNLVLPDPGKLHKHVSVVFSNDTFSAALAALKLARLAVDRSRVELPENASADDVRQAWAANHALLTTMIDVVVTEGDAQIDAVLAFFEMR